MRKIKRFSRRGIKKSISYSKIVVTALVVLLLAPIGWRVYDSLQKSPPPLSWSQSVLPTTSSKAVVLTWPLSGQAAIGSLEEGVLESSTKNEVMAPIASVAKIITSLAVLAAKPISLDGNGLTLTLNQGDVDIYNHYLASGGSTVAVLKGEQLTERQALEAMLLPSANNIADSLAIWAFGSTDAYVSYASNMINQWGLSHTAVQDASGFSAFTMSTPSDLIIIGQKALNDPIVSSIVRQKEATIPVVGTIKNINKLLKDNDVIGIKTGNTDEAGGCLLFATHHVIDSTHTITIIGAIQGASSLAAAFGAATNLLNDASKGFGSITILKENSTIGSLSSKWGSKTSVKAERSIIYYGWLGVTHKLIVDIGSINAPVKVGQTIGSIGLEGGSPIHSTPILAEQSIVLPSLLWRLRH